MARNSIIQSLSPEEREVLALCAITQDAQLARVGPHALFKDMEAAAAVFSDSLEYQPEYSRVEYICKVAAGNQPAKENDGDSDLPEKGTAIPGWERPAADEPQKRRYSKATGRMLVDDHHDAKMATGLDERRRREDPRSFAHSICCAHPVATYLGAWATLLFVAAIVLVVLSAVGLLIGIEFEKEHGIAAVAGLVLIILFYTISVRSATCSTCRIGIFSFRRYPRHRKAHFIPLLGYTVATALYTIFFLRYRCPSCGTPQKLFGRRHHSRRKR